MEPLASDMVRGVSMVYVKGAADGEHEAKETREPRLRMGTTGVT